MNNKQDYIICHYGEIALKGGNRKLFEEKLIKNIKERIGSENLEFIKRISGRILAKTNKKAEKEKITESLKNVFGLEGFSFVTKEEAQIDKIKKSIANILKDKDFETFRVSTKRAQKNFPLDSQEINVEVGAYIVEKLEKKVKLKNSDINCFIEIVENSAYIYTEKTNAQGGLPIGISGRAVSLISGGIDSPVASYYAMKRGVELVFVHFHSYPYTNQSSIEKVKELVRVLTNFQLKAKLYLIPFIDIQKEIKLKTKDKFRIILYRRFMMRIAEIIAKKERALALVAGDSIGQVASQTLENMQSISSAVKINIIKPLITNNKEEIITKAKEIGTYNISILPHEDSCSRFMPKRPETKSKLDEVKKEEENLNSEKLIEETLNKLEILTINYVNKS